MATLERYYNLLCKWQHAINLVGDDTLSDTWRRHMLDSAQLFPLLPGLDAEVYDVGSGAGFPGMVLALMGARRVHLVERDQRKIAFLATVARETGAPVTLHAKDTADLPPARADVVTARALAPLARLLDLTSPLIGPKTLCLFPKGAQVDDELADAATTWDFEIRRVPSRSDPSGTILCLREVHRHAA